MTSLSIIRAGFLLLPFVTGSAGENPIPALPKQARLDMTEDWSSGEIDPAKWYALRKQWGSGNNGVVPENVEVIKDGDRFVLRCRAHGDHYSGNVGGLWNQKKRVGGVLVSRQHFASGRFEVEMKIGTPENPTPPGIVPAIWTYGFRAVQGNPEQSDNFQPDNPLYHPYLQNWAKGLTVYWSEIDFPEFGKGGKYDAAMYNTFLNKQHDSRTFPVPGIADGTWHTYTTEWRTFLEPLPQVRDDQVAEHEGFHWVQDKEVPYDKYWGNPLKRTGKNQYSVYSGKIARHWIDGKFLAENTRFVPSMTGQLNIGVWLPDWAGEAPWERSTVEFGKIRVWQYDDPGDVRGFLTEDIEDSFDDKGEPVKP